MCHILDIVVTKILALLSLGNYKAWTIWWWTARVVKQIKLENRICRPIQDLQASFSLKESRKHRACRGSQSCTHTPFVSNGPKVSLFLFHGLWFSRYKQIIKIAIFGHETWPLAKVPEVTHVLSFYPQGINWAYCCSTGTAIRYTVFQIGIFLAWNFGR